MFLGSLMLSNECAPPFPVGEATLLAVDGSVTADIPDQVKRIPANATHLLLSVGGNDALGVSGILTMPASNASSVFLKLAEVRDEFEKKYALALQAVLKVGKPLTICTIYNPNYGRKTDRQRMAEIGLTVFNDVITREAALWGLPVLDLRSFFTTPEDYANPIEPSSLGGKKIAEHVRTIVTKHDFTNKQSAWYPTP